MEIDFKRNYTVKFKKIEKPIIFIISDEYASPNEIYKITKDSSCYQFSNLLQNYKWVVINSFMSNKLKTSESVSEIFNFNENKNYYKINNLQNDEKIKTLINPLLLDSIYSKGISFINFSIFNIGENKAFTNISYTPNSFLDEILNHTALNQIKIGTGSFKFANFDLKYYPTEIHNKFIFGSIPDSLKRIPQSNFMAYVHLYMPHSPFQFSPEFKYKKNNTENYIKYWHFTSYKLQELMLKLSNENKYRIILTGDHGYRQDNRIDPTKTFTAFYGFEKSDIAQVKSVQDLGILINHYF